MPEVTFTDSNFQKEVLDAKGVVLVDFFATWCGPCKAMGPVIDELAHEVTNAKIGKLNVDDASRTASQFSIRSIPTIIIFKNGKEVKRLSGFQEKDALLKLLQNA